VDSVSKLILVSPELISFKAPLLSLPVLSGSLCLLLYLEDSGSGLALCYLFLESSQLKVSLAFNDRELVAELVKFTVLTDQFLSLGIRVFLQGRMLKSQVLKLPFQRLIVRCQQIQFLTLMLDYILHVPNLIVKRSGIVSNSS